MNFIRVFIFIIFTGQFLLGCNTADQSPVNDRTTTNTIRTESFTYNISDVTLTQNTSNASIFPNQSFDNYYFEALPALPSGLSLNTSTGEISGVPIGTQTEAEYLIQATSLDGDQQYAVISITVIEEPPKTINYDFQTLTFNKDVPASYDATTTGGIITNYAVSPDLPSGLTIDSTTGDIGGTPTAPGGGVFTITASNSSGSASTSITITIADAIPAGLSYSNDGQSINVGDAFVTMVPSLGTAPATIAYTVIPQLPDGLTLNTDGSISGTPTETLGITDYTVTALNGAGSTSVVIQITISNPATALSYPVTTIEAQQGVAISPTSVQSYTGGTPVTYACTGCPTGITVSSTTGLISGTTSDALGSNIITVTASHAPTASSTTTNVTFNIVENYPEDPTYMGYIDEFLIYEDQAFSFTPSAAGGMPTTFAITPDLTTTIPGLTFNTTTGQISGTPTDDIAPTVFTVTGFNLDETSTNVVRSVQSFSIQVQTLPPIMLGYLPTTSIFYNATTNTFELQDGSNLSIDIIPNITSGGIPDTYSISPPLPDGLTLNPLTGEITGTPSEIKPVKYYTITGTNNSGSYSETLAISTNTLIAPISLSYNGGTNALALTIFNLVTEVPTYAGSQGTFTVSPDLPSGLTLNSQTGEITGVPVVAYAGTQTFDITVTNLLGSITTSVDIDITNVAPANLAYEDTVASTNISFNEGDIVTNTNIIHYSDYDDNYSAGFITNYAENGTTRFDGVEGVEPSGLLLDATTGDITGTAAATDPQELAPGFEPIQIDGTNAIGTASALFGIQVLELAPSISYNGLTNIVTVQGDERNTGGAPLIVDPYLVTPANAGGQIALRNATGGADAGAFCTATETSSINATIFDIAEAEGATVDGDPTTDHVAMTSISVSGGDNTPASNFEFDAATCSFRFNKTQCFGTGDTKVYNVLARNSGNQVGVQTPLTVHFYDGPNFDFNPDTDANDFFDGVTHLTIDGSTDGDFYTPDTTDRCHLGDYTLSNLSDLPTPFTFSTTDGTIAHSGQNLLGRRNFILESVETNSGLNLTQTENISVQANHIEANSGNAAHLLQASTFDVNLDGFQDLIIQNTACYDKDGDGAPDGGATCTGATVTTSIYLQSSATLGLLQGVNVAAFPNFSDLKQTALTAIQYDSAKAGILYIVNGSGNLSADSTTDIAESSTTAMTTAGGSYLGIVSHSTGITSSFGVVIDNGTGIVIDQYTITGSDLNNIAAGITPTVTIQNDTNGGIDLGTGGVQVVTQHDSDGDGNQDIVIGYVDQTDGDQTKICIIPSDGIDFADTCSTRLNIPNGGDITEIKFADVTGDTLLDMIVLTNDTVPTTNNSIYIYENQNNTFAGLYQAVDTLNLSSDSPFVNFDLADTNGDNLIDIVANDIEGDIDGDSTDDGIVSGLTVYYNSNNASDLFSPTLSTEFSTELHYSNSAGDSNDIELIEFNGNQLILHCQQDIDAGAATTSDGSSLTTYRNSSCGIIGSF